MPCDIVRELPIEINGQLLVLDQTTGKLAQIPPSKISIIQNNLKHTSLAPIPSTVFHNLIITNLTEVFPSLHLDMIDKMQVAENIINTDTYHLRSEAHFPEYKSFFSSQLDKIFQRPWAMWVSIVCTYVSIKVVLHLAVRICLPDLAMALTYIKGISDLSFPFWRRRTTFDARFQAEPQHTESKGPLQLSQWPPRVSFKDTRVSP